MVGFCDTVPWNALTDASFAVVPDVSRSRQNPSGPSVQINWPYESAGMLAQPVVAPATSVSIGENGSPNDPTATTSPANTARTAERLPSLVLLTTHAPPPEMIAIL